MNKINVVNDNIEIIESDLKLEFDIEEKSELFTVNTLKIKVLESTKLDISYLHEVDTKLNVIINVEPNVDFELFEERSLGKVKIQYQYYLKQNSHVNVSKFYHAKKVREYMTVNLNGVGASFNYNHQTLSTTDEKYDIVIYHHSKNTSSDINNHGVNIKDGSIIFNVTSFVPRNSKDCIVNQQSRIITMNDKKCQINPNLMIDEYEVSANHSALIGTFSNQELFYLMSRGIPKEKAIFLLMEGFLLKGITFDKKDYVKELIKKI